MKSYIDKAKVVAEIEKYISNYKEILNEIDKSNDEWVTSTLMLESKIDVLQHILYFLNTLEVKEVDLEEEFGNYIEHYRNIETGYTMFGIAEYFFELGLKAQKGGEE
jgi:hypothetical protein